MGLGKFILPIKQGTEQPAPDVWSPPADWIDISVVGDNEINLLVCDLAVPSIAFAVTTASGTYSIDWGDGTVETSRTSTTTYQHSYTVGTGTACSLGYTTFKIRIYGATGDITAFGMKRHTASANVQYAPLLSAVFGTTGLTSLASAFGNITTLFCTMLQSVTLPATLSSITSLANTFKDCYELRYVTMPTGMTALTTLAYTFNNCNSLKDIILPATLNNLTTMESTFYGCTSLDTVTMPTSMNSLTSLYRTFYQCYSLVIIVFPTALDSVTTMYECFYQCYKLVTATLPETIDSASLTMAYMFQECSALQYITFPASLNQLTSFVSCFNGCSSLYSVTLPTSVTGLTSVTSMFYNCYSIQAITLPDMTAVTSMDSMFRLCFSLATITNLGNLGATGSNITATNFMITTEMLTTDISLACRLSSLQISGLSGKLNKIDSIRLTNANSTFTGGINISYNSLDATALDTLFGDLPTVTSKTINITGCTGAATCDKTIATNKGWTVTG